jgi:hypothetical protein
MKRAILMCTALIICLIACGGCLSGTGLEKKTTLVPDSITIGYTQEQYGGWRNDWDGFSISGTWTFK